MKIILHGRYSRSGFTIVELLIVIVVIAVLAAISIVAYNGIQIRAKNTARVTSAQQAIKAIQSYQAANANLPLVGYTTCVTEICTDYSGTAENASRTTLVNNMKTIANLPPSSPPAGNGGKYYGIWYNYRATGATFDGQTGQIVLLMFWLDGLSQDCGVSNLTIQGPGEAWQRSTNKYSYNYPADNATGCWVAIVG